MAELVVFQTGVINFDKFQLMSGHWTETFEIFIGICRRLTVNVLDIENIISLSCLLDVGLFSH